MKVDYSDPKVSPIIERISGDDWCHLCGRRSNPQVFVRSVPNAEWPRDGKGPDVLLRSCSTCLDTMQKVILDGKNQYFGILTGDPKGSALPHNDRSVASLQTILGNLCEYEHKHEQVVYIVQAKDACKIGVTRNIRQRLDQLQTGNPHKIVLLATFVGGENQERKLHSRFSRHRLSGEWFESSPVLAWLQEVLG